MTTSIKKKTTAKNLRFGIEFELFTLDEKGYMTNGADRLIKAVNTRHPEINIKREIGKNMVELNTNPYTEVAGAMLQTLEDFEAVATCARKEGLVLYAYGTYPGTFTPETHNLKRYNALKKIYGEKRFNHFGRCIGLHIHYSLPWGVFDYLEKMIKPLIVSKNKQSMVNIYNLAIAMDPALTCFTQSSPFYQGKYLAKDSRILAFRGGKELDYPQGIFTDLPQFGALQSYMSTNTDLLNLIKQRFTEWTDLAISIGHKAEMLTKYGSILDNTWNPVKINAHGTMEIRGMDINHPDIVVAVASAIKHIFKAIQEKFLNVVPSDKGIENPFLLEGKTIYIPPDSYVRTELQKLSAYEGLDSDIIYKYCQNLLKLAKNFMPEKKWPLLAPLETILANKQTASDRILKKVKDLGFDITDGLTDGQAAQLALILSADLYSEIMITKQNLALYLEGK